MNRAELIDAVAARVGISKQQAGEAVQAITDEVTRSVAKGQKVALTGFGVFEKADRKARTGRNPQTGDTVKIKKTSVPKFRPGAQFKGVVSGAVKLSKVAESRARATVGRAAGSGTTKSTARKAPAKSSSARSSAPTSSSARKSTAKKSTTARKNTGTKATSKKTTGQSSRSKSTAKSGSAKKSTARKR